MTKITVRFLELDKPDRNGMVISKSAIEEYLKNNSRYNERIEGNYLIGEIDHESIH